MVKMATSLSQDLDLGDQQYVCRGCENKLFDFLFIANDDEKLNQFLCDHGVLPKCKNCPKCGYPMKLNVSQQTFHCYNPKRFVEEKSNKKVIQKCAKSSSQNSDTIFSRVHVPRKEICKLISLWALIPPPRIEIMNSELSLSQATCIEWCRYLRSICEYHILQTRKMLGGIGKIVEIDKMKLSGCNKKNKLAFSWIFGGIEQGSKNIFLIPVAACDRKKTLLQGIKDNILPGTTIVSKCGWKSLGCLEKEGYVHLIVDNRPTFVDPSTGAHTQTIVRLWREVKSKLPKYGSPKKYLKGYLAEFVFKNMYPDYLTRIHHIFTAIASSYLFIQPVNHNSRPVKQKSRPAKQKNRPVNHSSDLVNDSQISESNINNIKILSDHQYHYQASVCESADKSGCSLSLNFKTESNEDPSNQSLIIFDDPENHSSCSIEIIASTG